MTMTMANLRDKYGSHFQAKGASTDDFHTKFKDSM
jgi:hypothetical protein